MTMKTTLTNNQFLKIIEASFNCFLDAETSRSTQKLKPLHGAIAQDIAHRLGDSYKILSQGYGNDKEGTIEGRYMNKQVDITISQNKKTIAGIAVKFVMQNYSQNSNNYFENMLGETANIRCNRHPYFQIFIILDKLPYYNKDKEIKRWETFTSHNVSKYVNLSNDNVEFSLHTPNKTLIYVVHIPDNESLLTKDEYMSFYKSIEYDMEISSCKYEAFGDAVIINDYEQFMNKVYHTILSL